MRNENHQRLTHETFSIDRILRATKIYSFASYSVPGIFKGLRIQNHTNQRILAPVVPTSLPHPKSSAKNIIPKKNDVNSRFPRLKKTHLFLSNSKQI